MIKKLKKKKLIIKFSIIILVSYFFINLFIGNQSFNSLKSIISYEKKEFIKKYFFPYQAISQRDKKISQLIKLRDNERFELNFIRSGANIATLESYVNLSNNKTLKKYSLLSGFYSGIHENSKGTGFIDFHENKIIIMSSRGIIAFKKNIEDNETSFIQIKNNIEKFININQYKKGNEYSLKDMLIFKNKIYISYTEEIKEQCWNTSVIYGEMNFGKIKFKKFFSPKECLNSHFNIDNEFTAYQSGGKLIPFYDNYILLSVGDYRTRYLAQDVKSVNGKIIKINTVDSNYEIVSMGHRNPQGLYFDKENNFVLEAEHGPEGGDEINLIKTSESIEGRIPNYGWPISSAGEHYGGKYDQTNAKKYQKYPLYKSHSEHGFIEPLKSFVPSIGISKIVKISKNKYVVGSMKDKSLYFFELNEKKEIFNLNRVQVFERVRDLKFKDNKLYLFMENTPSIGIMNLS